ncbi:MAG: N-6 DNA methylase [Thermogemmatispora sp.]|uniref:Eco57I restriction-modification methylase domain-containing protein n=1 Tax=Thermogemmatispora sp. TaxID=1968838 RepID=UPI0026268CAF|nr:N-6 DNA methylase [Thermogemmatispora sp.]MBX5457245.1 N-6 DNA methylase [Thermogemmatispora sp.]
MDLPAEREALIDQRERNAAVGLPALKERTCEAIVLVLTALVRQAQRLLAGQAEQTALSKRGQLARLALQDLAGLYEQTLRLIYRLFVTEAVERAGLLAEERSLGEPEAAEDKEDRAYRLWGDLQRRWTLMRVGYRQPGLTLAPYPGHLFDPETTPYLEALPLPDAVLTRVLALLNGLPLSYEVSAETGWTWQPAALYEDLLAYEPRLAGELLHEVQDRGRRFVIPARLNVSAANDGQVLYSVVRIIAPGSIYLAPSSGRKSSGSYSTPPALISYLVQRTLAPLVRSCQRAEEVLALRVVDPAMGTGAFLVAACDYLARACACFPDTVSAPEQAGLAESLPYRRLVAERCLYGVDLDELAVELARLSLWLFTGQPEQPATFLRHNLRCGNSLIGMPWPWEAAVSEAASQPQHLASLLRLIPLPGAVLPQTSAERAQARRLADLWVALWFWPRSQSAAEEGGEAAGVEAAPPLPDRRTCAALVAALARPGGDPPSEDGMQGEPPALTSYLRTLERLIRRLRPFHWPLEFPAVFFEGDGRLRAQPGFDAVLGNPPWEILKPNSREFFASYDPLYRRLERAEAERQRQSLLADRSVERSWRGRTHWLAKLSRYVRVSGLYPAQRTPIGGKASGGDLNSYRLFVERSYRLLRPGGHCGLVVPAGLYTDQSSTGLRRLLLEEGRLLVLLGFENRAALFPIDIRCKFALLVFAREQPQPAAHVRVAFMLRDPAVLQNDEEEFTIRLPCALIARFAPETLSLLELRTQREADLLSCIYANRPLLGEQQAEQEAGAWSVVLMREFDMTSDRPLFNRAGQGWPLYEGKTIHQYCATFAEPRYHVLPAVGRQALLHSEMARLERALDALARERWPQLLPGSGRPERVAALLAAHGRGPLSAEDVRLDCEAPRLVFRRVASSTNERSLIATILPAGCFLGNTLTYIRPWRLDQGKLADLLSAGPAQPLSLALAYEPALSPTLLACLCGLLNSFVLDYVIRRKISVDITMFQVRQLPVPSLTEDQPHCWAIARRVARLVCLGPAFGALRRQLLGREDAPVLPLERRQARQQLRNEIDAIVAHLYGLNARDLRELLFAPQNFPLVPHTVKEGVLHAFAAVERLLEGK